MRIFSRRNIWKGTCSENEAGLPEVVSAHRRWIWTFSIGPTLDLNRVIFLPFTEVFWHSFIIPLFFIYLFTYILSLLLNLVSLLAANLLMYLTAHLRAFLNRVQVPQKIDSCPRAVFIQSHSIPFTVLILQVIADMLHTDSVRFHPMCMLSKCGYLPNTIFPFPFLGSGLSFSVCQSCILCRFSFISGISGTSLFNSVSLMAYNIFYTSIPVLTSVLDKDLSEKTVMQHPQILFYCQAGRSVETSVCPKILIPGAAVALPAASSVFLQKKKKVGRWFSIATFSYLRHSVLSTGCWTRAHLPDGLGDPCSMWVRSHSCQNFLPLEPLIDQFRYFYYLCGSFFQMASYPCCFWLELAAERSWQ